MKKLYFPTGRVIVLGLLVLMASVCHGQTTNATVTGEVTDPSGAVVPGTSVSITNIDTGIVTKAVANEGGLYRISGLVPGVYKIDVSRQGFKSIVKTGIELHTEDVAAINFVMEVGTVAETVTVAAGEPLIDTQSTSLSDTVEGRQVEDAPLNGRNVMNLIALVPGVVSENLSGGNPASNQGSNNTQVVSYGSYQIGGGLNGWNATFVDGATVNDNGSPNVAIVPTQDSVAEFHLDTSAVTPQFGGFAGGVINFTTKSGTNQFHGSGYEYVRNTVLDANTWWNDRLAQAVPILNQNQFGASVGGPIYRNKTFFFFSWEQTRLLTKAAQFFRVPTVAEESGDFTGDYGTTTDGILDYGNQVGGVYTPAPPENCAGGGINKLCPAHISPAVQQMFKIHYFQPAATNPTQLATLQAQGYNQSFVGPQPNNEVQYVGRVDHQLNDKQKLFMRYSYWNVFIPNPAETKMPAIPTQPTGLTSQQYVAGDNYTLSPTLNADLRLSYIRWYNFQQSNGNGKFDLTQFGPNWATLQSEIPYSAPPSFGQNNWANEPYSIDIVTQDHFNNYAAALSLTKVMGHHSIVFGGEARRIETYDFTASSPTGSFNFSAQSTSVGASIAQLVSGISNSTGSQSLQVKVNPDNYSFYQGYYVTDTFRMTPKLTLNYGIRWELPGAWYEKHDHNSVLLATAANPLGSFTNPVPNGPTALMGVIAEVNSPAYSSRAETVVHTHLFEPRLGVTYAIDSNTVIRAGFGMSHPCLSCGGTTPDSSPLNSATTLNASGYSSIDAPYPNGVLLPPERSTQLMAPYSTYKETLIGAAVSGSIPNQPYGYVGQWNLNVERSFGNSTSLLVAYGGSRGTHLYAAGTNLDQLPDQYDSLGATLTTKVANPFFGIAQPSGKVGSATVNYGQMLVPYPQFSGVSDSSLAYGNSFYNALSTRVRKRFSAGATVNASFTWAHFITNESSTGTGGNNESAASTQDYTNLKAERSNALDDIPLTLTLNYILDAPFGKGKRFFNSSNGVVDHIISGWTWSGISTYQSGFLLPFSVNNGNVLSQNFYAGTIRPNVVPGQSKKVGGSRYSRVGQWFNTAAFVSPGSYAFGNESRVDSTIRADSIKNWDMNLAKNTAITEGISFQFRFEYFNVFNHPQYGTPSSVVGGSTYGQITANTGNGSTNANQPRIGQVSLRVIF